MMIKLKSSVKLTALIAISLIVLGIGLATSQAYQKEDFLKFISIETDITEIRESLYACNPTPSPYMLNLGRNFGKGNKYVRDSNVLEEQIYTSYRDQPVTGMTEICRKAYPNETKAIGDVCENKSVILGWNPIPINKTREVVWDGIVEPGICDKIILVTKVDAVLGERSIEVSLDFAGFEYPELSWYNGSFLNRICIDLNTTTDDTNFQARINWTYNGTEQCNFGDLRPVSNNSATAVPINAWIEYKADCNDALIVFNLSDDIIVTNTQPICIYFDNTTAVSPIWDGETTLPWYTGFEDNTLGNISGKDGWLQTVGGNEDFNVVNDDAWEGNHSLYAINPASDDNIENQLYVSGAATDGWSYGWKAAGEGNAGFNSMRLGVSLGIGIHFLANRDIEICAATPNCFVDIGDFVDNVWYSFNMSYENATETIACFGSTCGHYGMRNENNPVGEFILNFASSGEDLNNWMDDFYLINYSLNGFSYTFGALESAPAVGDTCDTCTIDCTENCDVGDALDCSGATLTMTGAGPISISAEITNFDEAIIRGGCVVRCELGGFCLI